MKTTDMTVTQGNDQFYPTPAALADKMLAGLDMNYVSSVLEPSAGKGDLVDVGLHLVLGHFFTAHLKCARRTGIGVRKLISFLATHTSYTFVLEKLKLRHSGKSLGVVAPSAPKRTPLHKNGSAYSGAVMHRETLYIKNHTLQILHPLSVLCSLFADI